MCITENYVTCVKREGTRKKEYRVEGEKLRGRGPLVTMDSTKEGVNRGKMRETYVVSGHFRDEGNFRN